MRSLASSSVVAVGLWVSGNSIDVWAADKAAGYQHTFEHTSFDVGGKTEAERRKVDENGFAKVIGPRGVFAVDLHNGLALAVPNGADDKSDDATTRVAAEKRMLDADKQTEQVLAYYTRAGLPKEQIAGTHLTTYLSAAATKQFGQQPVVDGYATILERAIEDIPVVDSVAWATLSEEGHVLSEWVFWPAISADVISDALRFRSAIASKESIFWIKLPPHLKNGKVVIRHTSATSDEKFEAFACYDVIEASTSSGPNPTSAAYVRHFDSGGKELRLPQEGRAASVSVK